MMNHLPSHEKNAFRWGWLAKMALRDARKSIPKLLLSIFSIVLGIGALVAINSFSENLNEDIENQVGTLLGADMSISSRFLPDSASMVILDSISGKMAREISFNTMVYFPKSEGTRLIQVRAIESNYPFYGLLETQPLNAAKVFHQSKRALVEETLLLQFEAEEGDSIRIGELMMSISGKLFTAPGQSGFSASVAPVIYMPVRYVNETKLIRPGSRIIYKYYFQFDEKTDVEKLAETIRTPLEAAGLRIETLEDRKRSLGRAYENLADFLNLVAFVALLLGCLGVASAVNVYLKSKLPIVATLRCLGLTRAQTFALYIIQVGTMGFIGGVLGAMVGTFLQQLLPFILSDFLVLEVSASISYVSIIGGIGLGVLIALLFALIPLLEVRNVSPLSALRQPFESQRIKRDSFIYLVYGLIFTFIFLFSLGQISDWKEALGFSVGIITGFLILWGIALLVMKGVKKYLPSHWPFWIRQGVANLYRPQNQTALLIVSIGLGTALISTMYFVQDLLLEEVNFGDQENQSNIILYGIQPNQREDLKDEIAITKVDFIREVPVVVMRLKKIGNRNANAILADSTLGVSDWVFRREYRATYRSELSKAEEISEGIWSGKKREDEQLVAISLEEEFAKNNLKVSIGDTLTFDIQGIEFLVRVGSFRKLDYQKDPFSFFVVFPEGVLEKAPQLDVMFLNAVDIEEGAIFQREIAQKFPTVSIIDLRFVMKTVENILEKVSFVIQFMALLSILTGLIVLISSVINSKYQRIKESVLLRTLGAHQRQILKINACEYAVLGLIASSVGVILSFIATWLLAIFNFETVFVPRFLPAFGIILLISFLTLLIGLSNIRSVLRKPPLVILRETVE